MTDGRRIVRYDHRLAISDLCARDAKLARLIQTVGDFQLRVKSTHSPFEALLESVVYQQLTGKVAATILGRVLALFPGQSHPKPEQVLAMPEETLRRAGLSRTKIASLKDLAARTLDGTVPTLDRIRRMPDDEIVSRLTGIRGIGVWTVHMLLIFRLGRPDVLPVGDYGVRCGYSLTFLRGSNDGEKLALPSAEELTKRGQRWRPWRSVASWYLWRAVDLEKMRKANARRAAAEN